MDGPVGVGDAVTLGDEVGLVPVVAVGGGKKCPAL